jgi:hypothetical protein
MPAGEPRLSIPLIILYAVMAALLLWAVLNSGFVPLELW